MVMSDGDGGIRGDGDGGGDGDGDSDGLGVIVSTAVPRAVCKWTSFQ